MSLYRIYIDETGNHDMNHVEDQNQRFLGLTGVIIESEYNKNIFQPEISDIKRKFFKVDPDIPIIFHRKEIINRRPPFDVLRDEEVEKSFNEKILDGLAKWHYRVITVVIDKKSHHEQYSVWRYHPYHYCLAVMLERFVLFLHYGKNQGDVMVESRGGVEDDKLMDSFRRLYHSGTDKIPPERWKATLTSGELKAKKKIADILGLQLADLIAHPSRREILIDHHLIDDNRDVFGDKICQILRKDKYLRSPTGKIEGYGKKLLP
jgi:hypothetical protein